MKKGLLLYIIMLLWTIVGCTSQAEEITLEEAEFDIIEQYLKEDMIKPVYGGEIYTSFEVLGTNKDKNEIYIWALISEYYLDNDNYEQGTAVSLPLVLKVDDQAEFEIMAHLEPGDGSMYGEDIKKYFPRSLHNTIYRYSENRIDSLIKDIENQLEIIK